MFGIAGNFIILMLQFLGSHKHTPFIDSGNFYHLPITFANSLDQDQDRHVGPDLDSNCLLL